jgi:hypothetical protein
MIFVFFVVPGVVIALSFVFGLMLAEVRGSPAPPR